MATLLVKVPRSIAVFLLASESPVPISWLLRHGPVSFWRAHRPGALPVAVPAAWGVGEAILFWFHRESRRIAGQSGLDGSRKLIAQGLYARVRHLRYLGMMTGVFGACLIVATPALWAAPIVWLPLALITIGAEERQPHARLGPAYAVYSDQVPAPLRVVSRQTQTAPRRGRP